MIDFAQGYVSIENEKPYRALLQTTPSKWRFWNGWERPLFDKKTHDIFCKDLQFYNSPNLDVCSVTGYFEARSLLTDFDLEYWEDLHDQYLPFEKHCFEVQDFGLHVDMTGLIWTKHNFAGEMAKYVGTPSVYLP